MVVELDTGAVFKLYDPVRKFAIYNNNFQQALGASASIFARASEVQRVRADSRAE